MMTALRPPPLSFHRACLGMCCALACTVASVAQTQTAVLEGTVRDTSGGIIPHAGVTLRNPQTNQTRTALTDLQGSFRFTDLPVGTYAVHVDFEGFAPYVHAGVILAIGQTSRLDVALQPAGVAANITVNAQPPPLDSRQTAVTTTIDTERIEELPVRSRHYLEFVLLAPGVSRARPATTTGVVTSTLPDSGFSFGGLRPRSNTLTIDGLDNNDEFSGSSRTELSLEIVREFRWSVTGGPLRTAERPAVASTS